MFTTTLNCRLYVCLAQAQRGQQLEHCLQEFCIFKVILKSCWKNLQNDCVFSPLRSGRLIGRKSSHFCGKMNLFLWGTFRLGIFKALLHVSQLFSCLRTKLVYISCWQKKGDKIMAKAEKSETDEIQTSNMSSLYCICLWLENKHLLFINVLKIHLTFLYDYIWLYKQIDNNDMTTMFHECVRKWSLFLPLKKNFFSFTNTLKSTVSKSFLTPIDLGESGRMAPLPLP